MAGRRTKLTPEVQGKIVQAIQDGNYFVTACRCAGIGLATALEWIQRGEGRDKDRPSNRLYAEFAKAVRQAEARMEVQTVEKVRQGFPENPRLALDFLSRRFPNRWSQQTTVTLLQKLAAEVQGMSDAELLASIGAADLPADTGALPDGGSPPSGAADPGTDGEPAPEAGE